MRTMILSCSRNSKLVGLTEVNVIRKVCSPECRRLSKPSQSNVSQLSRYIFCHIRDSCSSPYSPSTHFSLVMLSLSCILISEISIHVHTLKGLVPAEIAPSHVRL